MRCVGITFALLCGCSLPCCLAVKLQAKSQMTEAAFKNGKTILDSLAKDLEKSMQGALPLEEFAPSDDAHKETVEKMVNEIASVPSDIESRLDEAIKERMPGMLPFAPLLKEVFQTPNKNGLRTLGTMAMSLTHDPLLKTKFMQVAEQVSHACEGMVQHCVQTQLAKHVPLIALQVKSKLRSFLQIDKHRRSVVGSVRHEALANLSKAMVQNDISRGSGKLKGMALISFAPTWFFGSSSSSTASGKTYGRFQLFLPLVQVTKKGIHVLTGVDIWIPLGSAVFRIRVWGSMADIKFKPEEETDPDPSCKADEDAVDSQYKNSDEMPDDSEKYDAGLLAKFRREHKKIKEYLDAAEWFSKVQLLFGLYKNNFDGDAPAPTYREFFIGGEGNVEEKADESMEKVDEVDGHRMTVSEPVTYKAVLFPVIWDASWRPDGWAGSALILFRNTELDKEKGGVPSVFVLGSTGFYPSVGITEGACVGYWQFKPHDCESDEMVEEVIDAVGGV